MKGIAIVAGLIAGAMSQSAFAQALVLYEQTPEASNTRPLITTGNIDHNFSTQRLAEDFFPASTQAVTRVEWWGSMVSTTTGVEAGAVNLDGFLIQFFDASGAGGSPGATIHSEFVPFASLDTPVYGTGFRGGPVIQFGADLATPVAVSAGGRYWVAINADVTSPSAQAFTWLFQGEGGGTLGNELYATDGGASPPDGIWTLVTDLGNNGFTFRILSDCVDSDGDGLDDCAEFDIADGSGCPDPNNADSDGDTLSDGYEVLVLNTNPCLTDTDGDGVIDPFDPTPTSGLGTSDVEDAVRAASDLVSNLDPNLFDGPNENASRGRRNALSNKLQAAANAIAGGNENAAAILLSQARADLAALSDPATPEVQSILDLIDAILATF